MKGIEKKMFAFRIKEIALLSVVKSKRCRLFSYI